MASGRWTLSSMSRPMAAASNGWRSSMSSRARTWRWKSPGMQGHGRDRRLTGLIAIRGTPAHIRCDNGPEFIAHAVKNWLETSKIGPLYIEPGSPGRTVMPRVSTAGCGTNCWRRKSLRRSSRPRPWRSIGVWSTTTAGRTVSGLPDPGGVCRHVRSASSTRLAALGFRFSRGTHVAG